MALLHPLTPEQIEGFYKKVDALGAKGTALEEERLRVFLENAAIKLRNAEIAKENAVKENADKAAADKRAAALKTVAPKPLTPEPNVYFFKPEAIEAWGATQALLGKIFDDGLMPVAFKDPAFRAQRRGEFERYVNAFVPDPQTQQNLKKECQDIDHDRGAGAEYENASFLLDAFNKSLKICSSERRSSPFAKFSTNV